MKTLLILFGLAIGSTGCGGASGDTKASGSIVMNECNGPVSLTSVALCPTSMGVGAAFQEHLLKVGGQIYVVTQVGGAQSLTARPAGRYSTTDGRACNYTISATGAISFF